MYVAFKRGEEPEPVKPPKKKPYKQMIHEEALQLIAEWKHRDRIKARKQHGLIK